MLLVYGMSEKLDKKKMSDYINSILDTKIDFTKLSSKELNELYIIFTTPSKLVQVVGKATKTKLSDKVLNMRLGELLEGQGLVGLGIIPTLYDSFNLDILGLRGKKESKTEASDS